MWPCGHLAVGYLCYVGVIDGLERGEQELATLTALAVGTQFPDLVDKPLAWTLSVLPSGRSLAHSLLTAAVLLWVLARVWKGRQSIVYAFGLGWVSHSLSDIGPELFVGLVRGQSGQVDWPTYLLWPVLPSPGGSGGDSFLAHFRALEFDLYQQFQFLLFGTAVVVWLATGRPGFDELRQGVRERIASGT